jgi:vitamin B12 transporter
VNKSTVSVFLSLVILPAAAGAERLGPVIVTATRTEQPASEVISSVDVIGYEELLRLPAADLGEALRLRAGVEVARLGGPGQQTSVFVRGTDSNHVLVLVDGLRINPGTIGSASIQNIAPEQVERVEIVKGPRSALYGSDAIGGVINVITKKGAANGASLQAGYGRYETRTASLAAGIGDERSDASIGVTWIDSDGFPTRSGDDADRGYENLAVNGAARATVGSVELGLRAWHAEGTSEYSDFFVTPVDQDFENHAYAVTADFKPTEKWSSALMLGHAIDDLTQNQSPDFVETSRLTVDWQNDIVLGERQVLTAGALWQDEEADAESFGLPYASDTTSAQFYLQDQATIGANRFVFAGAYTDHEVFGGHATWNAEVARAIGANTEIAFAAGTAFRAPDATDLFGFGGNPELEPEQSESLEASWRQRIGQQQSLSLTLFRTEIDELIEFVVTDPETFEGENRNVDRARIEGAEAEWRYDSEAWSARASATLQDARDTATDLRLLRRAREHFTFALARHLRGHEFAVDLLYAGERRDFGFPVDISLPAYWLANLSARVVISQRWTMLARMENLFDEDYELASGFNTMGRSLFVSLRHEFR